MATVLFLCSAGTAAPFVFNLPPATGSANVAIIKKVDSNAQNVNVVPNGTDTIDGVNATVSISSRNAFIQLADAATGQWQIF